MKNPILLLFLLLPALLPAQKVATSTEMELKKNEEVISSVTTSDGHTYVFTAVRARPNDELSADDKITVNHYAADLNLIDKRPLAKKKSGKSDFIFLRAFLFAGKIVVFGRADDDNAGVSHLLLTEFDKATVSLSGEFSDALQVPYAPNPKAPACDFTFRFSPSNAMLGIGVTFQVSAQQSRPVYENDLVLVDASLNAEKRLKQLSVNSDFDYRLKDFLVTDDAQLVVLESKTQHLEYPEKYWTDKEFMNKLMSQRPVEQLVHYPRASHEADTTILVPIVKGALIQHSFLFQGGRSLYVSGELHCWPTGRQGERDTRRYFFIQSLSFSAKELPIEPENMAELTDPLRRKLFDPGPIDTVDQKLGTKGDFNFSFGMLAPDGSFVIAGEVYIDRVWPPFAQMQSDKNYTIKANTAGGYSISGPSHFVRTYKQLFIIRFNPDEGSLTGEAITREAETNREKRLTPPARGPLGDLFLHDGNSEPSILLMDRSGEAVSLRSSDLKGEQSDPFFSDTADHSLLIPEGPAQRVFVVRGMKSYYLLKME